MNSGPNIDWNAVRADFPLLRREVHGKPLVYLDSANTGQKPASVIETVDDFYRRHNANVSRAVHALGQRVLAVARDDRDGSLRDDRPRVHAFFDPVHGAAGDLHAVVQRLTNGVHARKRRQEGRVNVQHMAAKCVQKHRRQDAHEARQHDPLGAVPTQRFDQHLVERLARRVIFVRHHRGRHVRLLGAREREGVRAIAQHQAHAGVERTVGDGVEDGLQVRAIAGDEHP